MRLSESEQQNKIILGVPSVHTIMKEHHFLTQGAIQSIAVQYTFPGMPIPDYDY